MPEGWQRALVRFSVLAALIRRTSVSILAFLVLASINLLFLACLVPQAAAQTPPVSIENASAVEGNTIDFVVSRRGDSSQTLTIDYTAIAGRTGQSYLPAGSSDFMATSGQLTFNARETSKTISVKTTQDDAIEPKEERFILQVSGTYNGNNFEVEALGSIEEDDRATIAVTPHPFTITEGETESLTFELSEPVPHLVVISFTPMRHGTSTKNVGDGGATMADFEGDFTQVEIQVGQTKATIDFTAIEDTVAEPDEQFEFTLQSFNRNSGNARRGDYHRVNFSATGTTTLPQTVTIEDDDSPGTNQRIVYLHGGESMTQVTLDEGDSVSVTATLAGDVPTGDISIPLKVTGYPSEEITSSDYTIPSAVRIKSGERSGTVTLRSIQNNRDERHHQAHSKVGNHDQFQPPVPGSSRHSAVMSGSSTGESCRSVAIPARTRHRRHAGPMAPQARPGAGPQGAIRE